MLASASAVRALSLYNDPYFFLKRQLVWLLVALIAGHLASRLDYHRWRDIAPFLFLFSLLLLAIVLVPGIGVKVGGSRRWIHCGPVGFQPSELGKFSLVVVLSWWISKERRHAGEFVRGALIPCCFLGSVVLLIFCEPDFGTALLSAALGLSVLILGGTRMAHLLWFAVPGLLLFAAAVMRDPVRMRRVTSFLDWEMYAQTHSYQLVNALYAMTLGGGFGVGLGKSVQKQYYLPEAHTDFIFAIIGEEIGVGGTIGLLLLFGVIFVCGLMITVRAPDMFGRLMAFGITIMITAQALLNIGVVTGCLPTKGLPLPFISFGGSCLVTFGVGLGALVNIGEQGARRYAESDIRGIKNRLRSR